jgi:hypothetical protein
MGLSDGCEGVQDGKGLPDFEKRVGEDITQVQSGSMQRERWCRRADGDLLKMQPQASNSPISEVSTVSPLRGPSISA